MKYRRLFGGFYPKDGVTHRKILGIMNAAFGPWSEKSENSHVGTDGMVDINFDYISGLLPEEEFSFFLNEITPCIEMANFYVDADRGVFHYAYSEGKWSLASSEIVFSDSKPLNIRVSVVSAE